MDENNVLEKLIEVEDIAGKKACIYAKLLTEPSLAQAMEKTAQAHQKRKQALLVLSGVKK